MLLSLGTKRVSKADHVAHGSRVLREKAPKPRWMGTDEHRGFSCMEG